MKSLVDIRSDYGRRKVVVKSRGGRKKKERVGGRI
jgi:uncharacterized protein Veg